MVVMVNRNLVGCHHMQVVSEIDQVAIQTDGKYSQTQKQGKDLSDFSDHDFKCIDTPPVLVSVEPHRI